MDFLYKDSDGYVKLHRMADITHEITSELYFQNEHIGLISKQIGDIKRDFLAIESALNRFDGKQLNLVEAVEALTVELSTLSDKIERQSQQYNSLISIFNDLVGEVRQVKSELMNRKNGPFQVPSTGEIVSDSNVVEVLANLKDQVGMIQARTNDIFTLMSDRPNLDGIAQEMRDLRSEVDGLRSWVGEQNMARDRDMMIVNRTLTLPRMNSLKKTVMFDINQTNQSNPAPHGESDHPGQS